MYYRYTQKETIVVILVEMSCFFSVGLIGVAVFGLLLCMTIYALCKTSNKYPYR